MSLPRPCGSLFQLPPSSVTPDAGYGRAVLQSRRNSGRLPSLHGHFFQETFYGFQQYPVSFLLPAALPDPLLSGTVPLEELCPARIFPALLRLGRAGLYPAHDFRDPVRLHARPCDGPRGSASGHPPALSSAVGAHRPRLSRFLQVRRFPGRDGQCPRRYCHHAAPPRSSDRHQFLHLPDHELHHRPL